LFVIIVIIIVIGGGNDGSGKRCISSLEEKGLRMNKTLSPYYCY